MDKIAAFNLGDTFFGKDFFLQDLTDLGDLISILVSNSIAIAGVILVFLVIFAGITMISGSGDPQKLEQGKNILTAGIIGFIIVVGAFLIVRLLESSLGISI